MWRRVTRTPPLGGPLVQMVEAHREEIVDPLHSSHDQELIGEIEKEDRGGHREDRCKSSRDRSGLGIEGVEDHHDLLRLTRLLLRFETPG